MNSLVQDFNGMWTRPWMATDAATIREVIVADEYRTALYGGARGPELVIDVGAHIGSFARLWHEKNPEARIVCVEACPANAAVLRLNVGHFATVLEGAVIYEPGDLFLLDGGGGLNGATGADCGNSSTVVDAAQAERYRTAKTGDLFGHYRLHADPIRKYTLEEIMAITGDTEIGLLKLDCEGSEFSILQKTGVLGRTRTIFGEHHDQNSWRALLASGAFAGYDYGEMYSHDDRGVFHLENKEFGRERGPWLAPDVPVPNPRFTYRIDKPTVIRVVTAQGIGDTLWVFTKLAALLEREKARSAVIVFAGVDGRADPVLSSRAAEFVSRFDFVSGVQTMDKSLVEDPPLDADGQWRVAVSQPGWHTYEWMLQANGHLEHGNRLEDWLPDLPIDWDVMKTRFRRDPVEIKHAEAVAERGPYLCVYAGSLWSNTQGNHNRGPRWHPQHWADLIAALNPARIVVLGASYDASYWDVYAGPRVAAAYKGEIINMIGRCGIGQTVEIIRHSGGLIAFQSGLGCVSGLLGVPTCMWWRKHGDSISHEQYVTYREEENGAFVPKEMLESGLYVPAIYPGPEGFTPDHPWTPEKIAERIRAKWPMFNR